MTYFIAQSAEPSEKLATLSSASGRSCYQIGQTSNLAHSIEMQQMVSRHQISDGISYLLTYSRGLMSAPTFRSSFSRSIHSSLPIWIIGEDKNMTRSSRTLSWGRGLPSGPIFRARKNSRTEPALLIHEIFKLCTVVKCHLIPV